MDPKAAEEESPPLVLHHSEMEFPRGDVQHLRPLKRTYAQAGKSRSFSNTEKKLTVINGADLSKWTESAPRTKRARSRRYLCLDWQRFEKDGRRLQDLDNFSERGLTEKEVKGLIAVCRRCGHWKTRRTFDFHECPEVIDLTETDETDEVDDA
jgi:hypothetical protein